jgi:hypothetical protein
MAARRTMQVLLMLGGLIAWAVQFTIIYGVTSTLCGRGWADVTIIGLGAVQMSILAASLIAFAATAILLMVSVGKDRQMKDGTMSAADSFMNRAAVLINGLSLVVILWQGVPALILPACA